MNFSSLNYDDEPIEMFSNISNMINTNSEPICIANNLTEEPIKIRENLLNILNNKDVLPIDDPDFKDEEIDNIISKLKEFSRNFNILQKDLDESYEKYNECVENTKVNIH